VIRGLASNWPLVKLAGQSDTVFAKGLAALDNGIEVDALLMPPRRKASWATTRISMRSTMRISGFP
jgi:hypothetical protein